MNNPKVNLAVIGAGGREHALVWKLKRSKRAGKVYALPGSPAIPGSVDIPADNFSRIGEFCREQQVTLLVVGPEIPLAAGIADYFADGPITVFGPSQAGARLESSKTFAKAFMQRSGVAAASFRRAVNSLEALAACEEFGGAAVIKYDGLAGGKGVHVCGSMSDARRAVSEITASWGDADDSVPMVVEEMLIGQELSVIGITDGHEIQLLSASQDHKQLFDDDRGPNTGGMGAYTPVPWADDALMEEIKTAIITPTMRGLAAEKIDYIGVLYFGIMVTADGPKLLEYNVRLGDPEAQVILPALDGDLLELILACTEGSLGQCTPRTDGRTWIDVVLASEGYPADTVTGRPITGLTDLDAETLVFHAGTARIGSNWVSDGGRVLNIVSSAEDFETAFQTVYRECGKIQFNGMHYRRDIGRRERRIVIMISGRGSNMASILENTRSGCLTGLCRPVLVVSNNPASAGLSLASRHGVPTEVVDASRLGREEYDARLIEAVSTVQPDFVVLAGYMQVLSPAFVDRFTGRIINIHPADTRVHRGLRAYRWAFEHGLEQTWITVHYVDYGIDTGPIIDQAPVDLRGTASLEEVERRGLAVEHEFYSQVIARICRDKSFSLPGCPDTAKQGG